MINFFNWESKCFWVTGSLFSYRVRKQVVRVNNRLSNLLIINTGAPQQGRVLSPLLYSLYTV